MLARISPFPASHWLAAQCALWTLDGLFGRLPTQGFERWRSDDEGNVARCYGESWGSHWQHGPLRLAAWGVWIQEEEQCFAYLQHADRWLKLRGWSALNPEAIALAEASQAEAAPFVQALVLSLEELQASLPRRWEELGMLTAAGVLTRSAANHWHIHVGSRLLPAFCWHQQAPALK